MFKEQRGQKWRYGEWYKDPLTDKLKKATVTLDKEQDGKAIKLLRAIIEEKTKPGTDFTLEETAKMYLNAMQVAPQTKIRNSFAINKMVEWLGGYNKLDKLTAGYIKAQMLGTEKKPETLNEFLRRFKTFLRWAYQNDFLSSTECLDKLTNFKTKPHRQTIQDKFLNTTELNAVLNAMQDEGNRLVTEFLALSGLRIGELIALEDVDVAPDFIHVTKSYSTISHQITPGKTLASQRDIYIQPELADCIQRIRKFMAVRKYATENDDSPYFVVNRNGKMFTYYAYNKYFKEITERIIGRALTPHSLRHTHASLLMEKGVPIEAISRRLGHESSEITRQIYLHLTDGTKENDARMMAEISLLSPNCPQDTKKLPKVSIS